MRVAIIIIILVIFFIIATVAGLGIYFYLHSEDLCTTTILGKFCIPTKKGGESCTVNSQCLNGTCARPKAGTDDLVCCESGSSELYDGYYYCTDMPNGSACWSDAMCSSGYCAGNEGGLKIGACRATSRPTGANCTSNTECANNTCARPHAGTDDLVCCPSGKDELYDGYYYCTDMPNGSACWSDAMCSSGYCAGNEGGLKIGACRATSRPAGASCTSNSECANNTCARPHAGTDDLVCCPSGKNDLFGGYYYCTDMPKGSSCWSDAMCASHDCHGNWGGIRKGKCT